MRKIARGITATVLAAFAVGHAGPAGAVPFEELPANKRALYSAGAVAANALPVASALVEPKCLQGYILCKLTFALISVVAAGESLVMSGGADMDQPRDIVYRGFSGDWVLTPRDIAGDTSPELLPGAPPPADDKKSGGFTPPPL